MKIFLFCLFITYSKLCFAEESCEKEYEFIASKKVHQAIETIDDASTGKPGLIGKWRDYIRDRLMVIHKHPYPQITMEDGTSIKAYGLAADNFGTLTDEQAKLISIPDIKKEVDEMLAQAKSYPARKQDYFDEIATAAARVEALNKELASKQPWDAYFKEVSLPKALTDKDGNVIVVMEKEKFFNVPQMQIARDDAKKLVAERLNPRFFKMNGAEEFTMDQNILIKKLETYHHEIERQMALSENRNKPLKPEIKAIYDDIAAFFVDSKLKKLKPEYHLPYWTWSKMRWMQMFSEVKSVIQKDIPEIEGKIEKNNAIEFIKSLEPETQRALGINNVADSASFLGRTKLGKFAVAVSTGAAAGGSPLVYGAKAAWEYLISDAKAKELCAEEIDDDKFKACVVEYLQLKFPDKTIEEILKSKEVFLNPDGTIKDSKVAAEVKDALARKKKFAEKKSFRENSKEALMRAIQTVMNEKDPHSEGYKNKIISTKEDESFYLNLVGNSSPNIPSYLQARFPVDYPKYEEQVRSALQEPLDSTAQHDLIDQIKAEGADQLAEELDDIISARVKFKKKSKPNPRRN